MTAGYSGTASSCARGHRRTRSRSRPRWRRRAPGVSAQLESFALNTMEYIRRERDLLVDDARVPDVATHIRGRHALIVVRGYHYREDLAALRPYIREFRPAILGVDGGADALVDAGYRPDLIIGDFDSISDATLTCGAELVVHAYPDGRAPGLERIHDLGHGATVFPVLGTSEDAAMLLADGHGAALIVTVGTHATLAEFLDKGRSGMSSTFLTRLRVGGKLVDAKGVSRLYRSRISPWSLLGLVAAALVAIVAGAFSSPAGQFYMTRIAAQWEVFYYWLTGLFT
ncbi:putative cytokinetic ring protein SteA [Spiractinospora alimapuensis]|uniref:putative cytokinetic ring protein SteA n=1 Tax=Spiractinospora alimapuensis TaxID=2820884 RepID=UPI001F445C2A|nr:putative cytokinetic ring protein SteA [Spiractinospora alimapuensis]